LKNVNVRSRDVKRERDVVMEGGAECRVRLTAQAVVGNRSA
jgi:hypothetical protein